MEKMSQPEMAEVTRRMGHYTLDDLTKSETAMKSFATIMPYPLEEAIEDGGFHEMDEIFDKCVGYEKDRLLHGMRIAVGEMRDSAYRGGMSPRYPELEGDAETFARYDSPLPMPERAGRYVASCVGSSGVWTPDVIAQFEKPFDDPSWDKLVDIRDRMYIGGFASQVSGYCEDWMRSDRSMAEFAMLSRWDVGELQQPVMDEVVCNMANDVSKNLEKQRVNERIAQMTMPEGYDFREGAFADNGLEMG